MKLEELTTELGLPQFVETDCKEVSGLDLLGLRSIAERVSNQQLDGITTITPTVRYLSFYAWIIQRYFDLGGKDHWSSFVRFAKKIESAVVFGNLLAEPATSGLIGSDGARKRLGEESDPLTLGSLVKNPAVGIYSAVARDLGICWDRPNVPGLTNERGKALAQVVAKTLDDVPILQQINLEAEEQTADRSELKSLGERFAVPDPTEEERTLLIEAMLPATPNAQEIPRVRTYCMLLQMAGEMGAIPKENDVFDQVLRPSLDTVPAVLHVGYDAWAHFVVRDMLVAVHETAVGLVCRYLDLVDLPTHRLGAAEVLTGITEHVDQGLADMGFDSLDSSSPIGQLEEAIAGRLGHSIQTGAVRRWNGDLLESMVASRVIAGREDFASAALLPIAWSLAAARSQPETEDPSESRQNEGIVGQTRIGIHTVVCPEVQSWSNDKRTIRQVVGDLLRRSVDQHLRIGWSRLAREPWKDVSVLASDGEEWIYIKQLWAGRTASRLGQAMRWLQQVGLLQENGPTAAGQTILTDRLEALETTDPIDS